MNPLHHYGGPAACSGATPERMALPWWLLLPVLMLLAGGALAQTNIPLVSMTNTVWRYDDTGTDLGTAWRAVAYPAENLWPTGRGLFGVESSVPYPYPEPLRTTLVLNAGRTTYYFRTRFNLGSEPAGLKLRATAYVDDGAVFYVNGAELHRVRLPLNGSIAFTNQAELAFPEGVPVVFEFPATHLVRGDNVLAVEVHQHSATSSDAVFGCALEILIGEAPVLLNPSEPADRAVPQDGATVLAVSASGLPPPSFQWFKDGAAIAGAVQSTLALVNMSAAQAGSYFCRVSNTVGSVTSRTAVVTYLPDTNGPAILYALGRQSLHEVQVVFSEPPNVDEAIDGFNWEIVESGTERNLMTLQGFLDSETVLILPTLEPRDPNRNYVLRLTFPLREREDADHGNVLPAGTQTPIALFATTLIPNDGAQRWRYEDSGSDLSTNWFRPDYDDSGWRQGTDPFDAARDGAGNCRPSLPNTVFPVRTCLMLSNAANTAAIPTIYFRTHFTFEGDAAHSLLRLQAIVDDGAVFYLNGAEIARLGMPSGPITFNTLATREGNFETVSLEADAPTLVAGDNVLGVELHQVAGVLPDFTFSLQLDGVLPARPRPRLTAQQVGGNLHLSWFPEGGTLETTDDPAGAWTPVAEAHPPGEFTAPATESKRFYRVVAP